MLPSLINGISNITPLHSNNQVKAKKTPIKAQQSFKTELNQALNKTNELQKDGQLTLEKLIQGENVDLHQVMIAQQKALISLQTTVEVRNKVIESYQEIMRMQV